MNVAQLLVRAARVRPHAPALAIGVRILCDYAGFARRVAGLAAGLRARFGVGPGTRVAIFMGNAPAYLEAMYAAWFAGAAVVPVNAKLHGREAAYIVRASDAALAIVDQAHGQALAAGLAGEGASAALLDWASRDYQALSDTAPAGAADAAPDDLAWLFYTSGTTGRPKGAMLSHRNLLAMTACYFTDVDSIGPDDGILYAAPISHGAGMYNFAHVLRGALHVVPVSGGFEPGEILALGRAHRGLSMFAAPTMVRRLVDTVAAGGDGDAPGLRTIVYGGGPMYLHDILDALRVMGPRFVQIYGQGESPMTITALGREHHLDTRHPRHRERLASVGVAQSLVEVRVVDAGGRALPEGETGEVVVRGDTVMLGYWRDPAATAATIRDRWLYTGDVGAFDVDGFLTLKDRSKDVIISGGSNVYPREVEEVLLEHPDVLEVSVLGRPDPEWGEVVVAFVVMRAGRALDAAALDALCTQRIARFKRPRAYFGIESLPKNNYGKVLKTALRERLQGAARPHPAGAP